MLDAIEVDGRRIDRVVEAFGACHGRAETYKRDAVIDVLARHANLSRYLHLPVQSGSDRILGAMRRRYTAAEYRDIVRRLRRVRPDLAITTDLIVGFPGESDADFEATLELVVDD